MICVNFDKKLYSSKAIKTGTEIYKDWADFEISRHDKGVKVCVSAKEKDDEEYIKNEFCNYVLVLTGDIKANVL